MRIFTAASKGVGVDFGIGHRGGGGKYVIHMFCSGVCETRHKLQESQCRSDRTLYLICRLKQESTKIIKRAERHIKSTYNVTFRCKICTLYKCTYQVNLGMIWSTLGFLQLVMGSLYAFVAKYLNIIQNVNMCISFSN